MPEIVLEKITMEESEPVMDEAVPEPVPVVVEEATIPEPILEEEYVPEPPGLTRQRSQVAEPAAKKEAGLQRPKPKHHRPR